MSDAPTDDADLTPSEDLLVDVLIARLRLGEAFWTFSNRHRPTAKSLEGKGLVSMDSGSSPGAFRVFPTPALKERWMQGTYVPPILATIKPESPMRLAGVDVSPRQAPLEGVWAVHNYTDTVHVFPGELEALRFAMAEQKPVVEFVGWGEST
jgi:hypothetical protein